MARSGKRKSSGRRRSGGRGAPGWYGSLEAADEERRRRDEDSWKSYANSRDRYQQDSDYEGEDRD